MVSNTMLGVVVLFLYGTVDFFLKIIIKAKLFY